VEGTEKKVGVGFLSHISRLPYTDKKNLFYYSSQCPPT